MNSSFIEKQIDAYKAKFDKLLPKFKLAEEAYNDLSAKLSYLQVSISRDKKLLEILAQQEFEAKEKQRVAEEKKPELVEVKEEPLIVEEVHEQAPVKEESKIEELDA